MTKNELLQAAIARCQELQKENPTGQLVYDDELHGILQQLLDAKKEENLAKGVSQHLVGYSGITVPGEPEICAPYIPQIDLRDIKWSEYSQPVTLMDKFPDVEPIIDWDNAMLPGTAGGLKRGEVTVLAAPARQTGKTTLTADLIEQALERTTECPCVDCDGTEPTHIPECEYMADLHGSRERDRIPS